MSVSEPERALLILDERRKMGGTDLAIQRMVEEAEGLGADAVVNIRFATSAIIQGAAEVIAYGTAVKFVNK